MAQVSLNGQRMLNWDAFHHECKRVFGFPDFYGANMDAFIDCLSGVRDDDGMSAFVLTEGETLRITLEHSAELQRHAAHIAQALQEAVQEVNQRCQDSGQAPALELELR